MSFMVAFLKEKYYTYPSFLQKTCCHIRKERKKEKHIVCAYFPIAFLTAAASTACRIMVSLVYKVLLP